MHNYRLDWENLSVHWEMQLLMRIYLKGSMFLNVYCISASLRLYIYWLLWHFLHFYGWLTCSAPDRIKAMGQVLSKAREQLYDCNLVTGKLRAMLQSADEQVRSLKKQSTFLSQLAAKTIPNGIHCLSMRLTIDYYLLPLEKRKFPRSENLENPSLYHYALFSDNVLAASVVVNSTVKNAKVTWTIIFYTAI